MRAHALQDRGRSQPSQQTPIFGLKIKPFRFKNLSSAKLVPVNRPYKKIRYIEGKRNYVSFYFQVPPELAGKYPGLDFKRFRLFEHLNDAPDAATNRLAGEKLMQALVDILDEGHSPFLNELLFEELLAAPPPSTTPVLPILSLETGLKRFMDDRRKQGLRPGTIRTYQTAVNHLTEQLGERLSESIDGLSTVDLETFLDTLRETNEWGPQTYNNNLTNLKAIFGWFAHPKRKYIPTNPATTIDELPTDGKVHEYYTDRQATDMKALLLAGDERGRYLHQFCSFVYYTGIRPQAEARMLKVEHVLLERRQILIPGSVSKNRRAEHIPMSDELYALFTREMKIQDYPGSYYLFSAACRPDMIKAYPNYFSNGYKPYKDALGLPFHTIYSWKHTRAIHLAEAGVSPYDIKALFRHSSLEETETYLRGLGCRLSVATNRATRKF